MDSGSNSSKSGCGAWNDRLSPYANGEAETEKERFVLCGSVDGEAFMSVPRLARRWEEIAGDVAAGDLGALFHGDKAVGFAQPPSHFWEGDMGTFPNESSSDPSCKGSVPRIPKSSSSVGIVEQRRSRNRAYTE